MQSTSQQPKVRPVAESKDDVNRNRSEKSNRLFSALKTNRGPAPNGSDSGAPRRPVSAPVADVPTSNTDGGNKSRGRKRGRGKSAKGDSEHGHAAKAPSHPGEDTVDSETSGQATEMDVEEPASTVKPGFMTEHEFSSLSISEKTKRGLSERMKIRFMTQVQHASLPEILKGHDVLAKAKTGTGKTLAFLVPAIEMLMKERRHLEQLGRAQGGRASFPPARVLILSPTRELAQQILAEATALCSFHDVGCILLVGGTNMNSDVKAINRVGAGQNDIIVATPGRMLAHLKETAGFAEQIKGVKVYIMDEADRLLDMGFKRDIDQITNYLNQRNAAALGARQTLLFSATVAPEVREVARHTLLPGYKFVDTVGEEVEQTHAHVPQRVMCAPLDQQLKVIVQLLEQHKLENPGNHKIIMFFATARQTGYYASVLNAIGLPTLEIHSRKSQGHRTKVSEQFRVGKNVIMASSDVSARGMDYPDVTFVLQVGMTDRDQYIHRLGRTARAGKSGTGLLLLAPFEQDYMTRRELKDLPLQPVSAEDTLPKTPSALVTRAIATVRDLAAREAESDSPDVFGEDSERDGAKMAWQAWLGYYNGQCKKLNLSKEELVVKSAEYAATLGLPQIPALQKKTIGKMGLQGVPGLRVEATAKQSQPQQKGRGQPQQQQQQQQQAPAPAPAAAKQSTRPPAGAGKGPSAAPATGGRGGAPQRQQDARGSAGMGGRAQK